MELDSLTFTKGIEANYHSSLIERVTNQTQGGGLVPPNTIASLCPSQESQYAFWNLMAIFYGGIQKSGHRTTVTHSWDGAMRGRYKQLYAKSEGSVARNLVHDIPEDLGDSIDTTLTKVPVAYIGLHILEGVLGPEVVYANQSTPLNWAQPSGVAALQNFEGLMLDSMCKLAYRTRDPEYGSFYRITDEHVSLTDKGRSVLAKQVESFFKKHVISPKKIKGVYSDYRRRLKWFRDGVLNDSIPAANFRWPEPEWTVTQQNRQEIADIVDQVIERVPNRPLSRDFVNQRMQEHKAVALALIETARPLDRRLTADSEDFPSMIIKLEAYRHFIGERVLLPLSQSLQNNELSIAAEEQALEKIDDGIDGCSDLGPFRDMAGRVRKALTIYELSSPLAAQIVDEDPLRDRLPNALGLLEERLTHGLAARYSDLSTQHDTMFQSPAEVVEQWYKYCNDFMNKFRIPG